MDINNADTSCKLTTQVQAPLQYIDLRPYSQLSRALELNSYSRESMVGNGVEWE